MNLFEAISVNGWVGVLLVAGLAMAALAAYALVMWDRTANAADRWREAAQAYAKMVRQGRTPALTQVAPQFHAPSDADRRADPFGIHVRPTRVFKAPWLE
jgi:HAMP domain-containing protein